MPGFASLDSVHGALLAGTAAITCKAGVFGTAGAVRDTELFGVIILKNAGPATLTITGLTDNTGTAQNVVLSGGTAADTPYIFPWPLLNAGAAFSLQPSVTLTCLVFVRAYIGP